MSRHHIQGTIVQVVQGFQLDGLSRVELDAYQVHSDRIVRALGDAMRHELQMIGVQAPQVKPLRAEETLDCVRSADAQARHPHLNIGPAAIRVRRGIGIGILDRAIEDALKQACLARTATGFAAKDQKPKPKGEPGLPLRQFVRGFLRDHLGTSKIVAHTLADLFMKRWLSNDDATRLRYADGMEDDHTRAATFDRHALELADKRSGMDGPKKAEVTQGITEAGLTFPNAPAGLDDQVRVFGTPGY